MDRYMNQCEIRCQNLTNIYLQRDATSAVSAVAVEFPAEPGSGVSPVPVGSSYVQAEVGSRLFDCLPEEETEVDQPRGAGMRLGQPGKGFIDREQVIPG